METVFNYFMQWSSVDYQMATRFFCMQPFLFNSVSMLINFYMNWALNVA